MKILEYNDLDVSMVRRKYEKVTSFLERNDFRSAEVKKIAEGGLYRAKLDSENRLIFKLAKYKGQRYALMLEVVLNHAYDRSKFLRGARIDETKIPLSEIKDDDLPSLVYINPSNRRFHFLDKVISLDPEQEEAYNANPPLIIIGPAGSGKTAITLEKFKLLYGQGIYVTLSPYLTENARNIFYSHHYENENQDITFLSFREFLETMRIPDGKEMRYSIFSNWLYRFPRGQRVADAHRLYEEFRGVITGSCVDKPYFSREEYLNLGVRQSIFLDHDRELVYTLFEKYLTFLKENGYYDPNIVAHNYLKDISPVYDFVVVDEVQDITNIQLYLILKSLKNPENFILCGDSNQIVHPNFFSWSKLKSMFYTSVELEGKKIMRIIQSNFRNSQTITDLSNKLLMIKQKRFGSIDRESTYLMRSLSEDKGDVVFLKNTDRVKAEMNKAIRRSTKFAVLVMRDDEKTSVRKFFDTPLIFSIQEAKGLEYENVILLNFVSGERQNFQEIINGVTEEDLDGDLRYMRASDKRDKSLDVYKFFINSLYVAVTRAMKRLYIMEEDTAHFLFQLIGLKNALEHIRIDASQSSIEEWQAEARRLELQGKQEQAEEIRRTILKTQPVPWEICTSERLEELVTQIRTAKDNPQRPRKILFEYSLFYDLPMIMEFLSRHEFVKAKQICLFQAGELTFNSHLYNQQRKNFLLNYTAKYRSSYYKEILRQCELYGIDHRTEFNCTPLIHAAEAGNVCLVKELLSKEADRGAVDNHGMTAWQKAFQVAVGGNAFVNTFAQIHEILLPSGINLRVEDKLIKIDSRQGEFLLFNLFFVKIPSIVNYIRGALALSAVEIAKMMSNLPESVIPEYRKKRQYISALLAKNEINSSNPYCRKLFKRVKRGQYILNSDIKIRYKDDWIDIYCFSGIETIYRIISDDEKSFDDKHQYLQSMDR
ncbi:MAG: UvrD-helicase domain-containing protein [Thermodesulfovibrionales bacterium]|nr:UvrD-helicase domain-containing protein [Thermodesulfovibrionales bacterium]